jgi:hypothetical protein
MGLQGTLIDPTNRELNYGAQPGSALTLRMNGNVELPFGPNKLVMGNSTGWVARAIERWQASFIYNAASTNYATANPAFAHLYGAFPNPGTTGWTVASPNWVLPKGDLQWSGNSGSLYGNSYTSVQDPQCTDPTQVAATDKMGTNLQPSNVCQLTALALRNADGTPGEVMLKYGKPGEVGNLGFNNFSYFGNWTLDMGLSKTFKVHESTSVQIRIDASNVLNHPTPAAPGFTTGQFGVVTNKTDERALQGQLRISF